MLKNILIGLFVIAALATTVGIILFLEPSVGDGKKVLTVRFSNISGINVGTQVNLAGKPVGEVEAIAVIQDAREEPADELGRVYYYQLKLRVDSSVDVYNTDEVTIRTTGLMGEKSITIIPKAPKKGQVPKLVTNQIIYATSVDPLESALHHITNLANTIEGAVVDFDQWFMENHTELSRSVKAFADVMSGASTMIADINQQNLIPSVKEAIDLFSDNLALVRNALAEMEDRDMIAKFDYILENVAEATDYIRTDGKDIFANISSITKDIADGKGTIGKLIKKDDLYLRSVAVMSKVDTLMNDINHYGLLFQYDKHWQRIRTKRANLLQALQKPKDFKRYFEKELDEITTSLSRISILLDKAKDNKERKKIIDDQCFQKDFKVLLNQVEELMDTLKMYNEQLVETMNDCAAGQ